MNYRMILLVGEQPAPNLLPVLHFRPEQVLLVYTDLTERISDNLARLIRAKLVQEKRRHRPRLRAAIAPGLPVCVCKLDHAYNIARIRATLRDKLNELNWPADDMIFNLTGGIKPMALAAFGLAQEQRCRSIYFQTEGNRSLIYDYRFDSGQLVLADEINVSATITIDDYLRMYLGEYEEEGHKDALERVVGDALRAVAGISEVKAGIRPVGAEALEIDLVIRVGNQVGVAEVKMQGNKDPIDHLNAVGSQRYLGTYVKKFLISAHEVDRNNKNLAQAYQVEVIELPGYAEHRELLVAERDRLAQTVLGKLGGQR